MTQNVSEQFEPLSALVDGQLRGDEFARALATLEDSAEARSVWHAYHLVGDVLRSGESMVGRDDAGFVARLRSRLENEPALLRPSTIATQDATKIVADNAYSTGATGIKCLKNASANDSSFGWKLLAGLASMVAVAAIGWQALNIAGDRTGGAQLAQLPPQSATAVAVGQAEPAVMIRDPHLDALMAAHRQFGGTSALQMPAGFLRNATFEGPAR